MQLDLFNALFANAQTIFIFDIIANILIACLLALAISSLYRFTYKGYSYSTTFVTTLIIITMVTAVVIMVIGNNLARAFGLVGAMSIIRFRTALKDTRDIAFVFFSLAAGMAAGAGNHLIGIVGTLIIGLVTLILHRIDYGTIYQNELLLRFWIMPDDREVPIYMSVFQKYLSRHKMLNVRSARLGQFLELSFYVRFRKKENSQNFVKDLSALEGIDRVSLVVGEDTEPV